MHFDQRLDRARAGRGMLFCGAGFSADCLNFTDAATLGVSGELLRFFNNQLARIMQRKRADVA